MSLKPPWKQKNPVMEEACQAYHRNTAPEKAIEILKNLEAYSLKWEEYLSKEVVYNGGGKHYNATVVLFLHGEDPELVVSIATSKKDGEFIRLAIGKQTNANHKIYYKGEVIGTTGRGGLTLIRSLKP